MCDDFEEKAVVCEGTLMRFDRPLGTLYIDEDEHVEFTPIETNSRYYPYEMREFQGASTMLRFFKERVTPPTRQGLSEELQAAGYERYSIAAILLASNGRDCSDCYWIRFKDGPQTWDEVWAAIGVHGRLANIKDR